MVADPDTVDVGGRSEARMSGARTVLVAGLVVIGTLGFWTAGVSGQTLPIRLIAIVCGVGGAWLSAALSRRRDKLLGWFALVAAISVFRMLTP